MKKTIPYNEQERFQPIGTQILFLLKNTKHFIHLMQEAEASELTEKLFPKADLKEKKILHSFLGFYNNISVLDVFKEKPSYEMMRQLAHIINTYDSSFQPFVEIVQQTVDHTKKEHVKYIGKKYTPSYEP